MILARLTDLIRFEAGMPGTTKVTAFIQETILEELRDLTATDLFQELLNIDVAVTAGVISQQAFDLPADHQHIRNDRVRYRPGGDQDSEYFLFESESFDQTNSGQPRLFQLKGETILVYPSEGVTTGDKMVFDYYAAITALVDTDEFPVPSLQSTVKKKVIARLQAWMGKNSQQMQQGAAESVIASKGDGPTS